MFKQLDLEGANKRDKSQLTGIIKKVKIIMEEQPDTRNSDRAVAWVYWQKHGLMNLISLDGEPTWMISRAHMMRNISQDTISRACRKVREMHPELAGTKEVKSARAREEQQWRKVMSNRELMHG